MFDTSVELQDFYNVHVRLGKDRRNQLAEFRNINLKRLKDGLVSLGEKDGKEYPEFIDWKNQGSYAMHTLNQAEELDYDIDVAVIFKKGEMPESAAAARELVQNALCEKAGSFTKPPEARKNAVTIWYSEGYHIDFAVFRSEQKLFGPDVLEHAGADGWSERNPDDVTNWLTNQVDTRSPQPSGLEFFLSEKIVESKQLRRIIRFVKAFAKSRSGWSLPGGMILSTLVCEVYQPNQTRDDIALRDTLYALRSRLEFNKKVYSPVNRLCELTGKYSRAKEIDRLHKNLKKLLPKLEVLLQTDCTRAQALDAWNAIFNHTYWSTAVAKSIAESVLARSSLVLECGLARRKNGTPYEMYASNSKSLPKGIHLRFRVKSSNTPEPYSVKWIIQNEGDEASEAEQLNLTSVQDSGQDFWTSTSFKGRHKLRCEIYKNEALREVAEHGVRIASRG